MKLHAPLLLSIAILARAASAAPLAPDVIPAKGGPIRITPIYHGSLQIEYRGTVIHVDPFSAGNYSGAKKANLILITHTHPDHLDVKAIRALQRPGSTRTMAIAPAAAQPQLRSVVTLMPAPARGPVSMTLSDGASTTSLEVRAVPAYNIKRGPKPGQKFHPKGQFNGYVLTMGGKRIYIAGDTEATPEMKALKNIDVAFLPMNLPYTMTPQEAASGARAFKPKLVYPYHYRYPFTKPNNNPQQFAAALRGSGIQVKLRDWYANPAKKN